MHPARPYAERDARAALSAFCECRLSARSERPPSEPATTPRTTATTPRTTATTPARTPHTLRAAERSRIESAVKEHETGDAYRQRNIVPLMLEGFDFGTPKIASQLTGTLAALKYYNALNIPPDYFLEAMGRLRDRFLNVPLTAVLHPAFLSAQRAAREQKAAAGAAPAVQEKELTAQQWFERGLSAADFDEKLRFYTEAIRLKSDYAGAYNNRGVARRAKGDVDGARQDFADAIRLKPDDFADMPAPTTTEALRASPKAMWTASYRITPRTSGSSPTLPKPTTTGDLRAVTKAMWTASYRITPRTSGSSPTLPKPTTTGDLRAVTRATWTARYRITPRPSGSDTTHKGKPPYMYGPKAALKLPVSQRVDYETREEAPQNQGV